MFTKLPFLHWSLKYKFVMVFILFVTLPTICFGVYIYHQMNQTYKEQSVQSTEGIIQKIQGNLNSIIGDMENVSLYAIYNDDFRNFMMTPEDQLPTPAYNQSVDNIKGYLTFQLMSKDYINSFYLKGSNNSELTMGDSVSGDETKWNHLAARKEGGVVWSDAYDLSKGVSGKETVISLTRTINDFNDINHQIGFVRIRLDVNQLKKIIQIPTLKEQGTVFLMSQTGNVMIQGNNKATFNKKDLKTLNYKIMNHNRSYFNYSTGGHHYMAVTKKVKGVDWYVVALVSENQIDKSLLNIRELMRDMIIILTLLGLIALVGYYYSDIRRIIALTHSTRQLENKDFSVHVKVNVRDEIGKLGLRFNKMVETIQNHINMEYKLKIRQKESELKALQNQIDPHFLYNTLDMIRWKARLENAKETSYLIELLSKIFRSSLRNGQLYIHLQDELTFVKSYMDLQKKRLGDTLSYTIFVDYTIENVYIMKQVIQPLVENSIKHGFEGQRSEKKVSIRCYQRDHSLLIDVIDNGKGMDQETFTKSLNSNNTHALKNLHDRFSLAFGLGYGLRLIKNEKRGTWLQLQMPLFFNESDIEALYEGLGEINDENDHS